MTWTILLLTAVVLLGGVYWWLRGRRMPEGPYFLCRCPKCDRKIRYPASEVGHYAICPGCKHRVPLPRESEDEESPRPKVEEYHIRRKIDNARRR